MSVLARTYCGFFTREFFDAAAVSIIGNKASLVMMGNAHEEDTDKAQNGT